MKNKKNLIIISVVGLCILAVIIGLCFLGEEDKTKTRSKNKKISISSSTAEEYREIINDEIQKDSEYSQYTVGKFEKIVSKDIGTGETELIYNLYKSDITENFQIYILANDINNCIDQIRFRIKLSSGDESLKGFLLGVTMRLLYGNVSDEEMNSIVENLGIALPLEGNNKTYEFKENIYRTTVKNNYLTTYITLDSSTYFEEKFRF